MPSWENNPYCTPENVGVELLAAVDYREPNWSFDLFIVLRDKATGKVYVASDSGCSCPTPFEDHKWPEDYTEVRSWADVKREFDLVAGAQPYEGIMRARQKIVGAFRRV